ncbi:hypothetical protein Vretimale_12847, partial [Volvox reticuliferus]
MSSPTSSDNLNNGAADPSGDDASSSNQRTTDRETNEANNNEDLLLRIGTHNTNGIQDTPIRGDKVVKAAKLWEQQKLDIVCLQETHIKEDRQEVNYARFLGQLNTTLSQLGVQDNGRHWAIAAQSPSLTGGGVLILVRKNLKSALERHATQRTAGGGRRNSTQGYYTECVLNWGGHRIRLSNVYVPTISSKKGGQEEGRRQVRRQLFKKVLKETNSDSNREKNTIRIWAGDFNFVENPALDSSTGRQMGLDVELTGLRQAEHPDMVDIYRHLGNQQREYTHIARTQTSRRLDRFYINEPMKECVSDTTIIPEDQATAVSDHRLVVLCLSPSH